MSIFKLKFQAHRFVNLIFYFVVFIIGFLVGLGVKKIDFNNLISDFLFIDDVKAYSLGTYNDYEIDEEYIHDKFIEVFPNIDFNNFNNILCRYGTTNNKLTLSCYAFNSNAIKSENLSLIVSNDSTNILSVVGNDFHYYSFSYYLDSDTFFNLFEFPYDNENGGFLDNGWTMNFFADNQYYSNFDFVQLENVKNKPNNVLDFSKYTLEFNENLFKDNSDFKEVCVEEGKSFAITSTVMSDINSLYDYDYIWFPYNLNGLSKILYDNSIDSNEIHFTEEESKERYFYNTKENIDSFYSNDIPGLELELKGYIDKYSYYGWSAWPFRMYYDDPNYQFTIFELKEPTKIYVGNLSQDGSVHAGGGLRLDSDKEIELTREYCFYIKNTYEVTYVNVDEWNDFYGLVPTPNGDYEFNTSFNKLNQTTKGLMSQVNIFISHIKDTLNFIREHIYNFYLSMPLLFRMFLMSVLTVLIIKFIIEMVVR